MTKRQVKTSILSLACAFVAFVAATPAFAFTVPSFDSCINPPQDTFHFQNTGTHYVAGTTDAYSGTDSVYALDGNRQDTLSASSVMQCLCPENGQGIQTNWWKATDLSQFDINTLEAQGWVYVPEGSAWGLESAPYMAQNTNFSCNGANQASTGSSNNNNGGNNNTTSSNNSGSSSASNSSPVQSVLGAMTELANTGNILFLYSILAIGFIASGLAFVLRKNK